MPPIPGSIPPIPGTARYAPRVVPVPLPESPNRHPDRLGIGQTPQPGRKMRPRQQRVVPGGGDPLQIGLLPPALVRDHGVGGQVAEPLALPRDQARRSPHQIEQRQHIDERAADCAARSAGTAAAVPAHRSPAARARACRASARATATRARSRRRSRREDRARSPARRPNPC